MSWAVGLQGHDAIADGLRGLGRIDWGERCR